MNRKLVITQTDNQVISSLFENDDAVELHCEKHTDSRTPFAVGDIYIGKVKKIAANINAAFIEIAGGVECYYSLTQNNRPVFTSKHSSKPLNIGDELLVQVKKEAVKEKVPTVTGNLNFPGKYLVLTTGNPKLGVSSKLNSMRRSELRTLMEAYRSEDYGFIVRTNAGKAQSRELHREAGHLLRQYRMLMDIADKRTCFSCVYKAPEPYLSEIRNIYQENLTEIVVENRQIYQQVRQFLAEYQPEDIDKLRLYEDRMLPLHKLYAIETLLTAALREKVWMKSGAYLIIQPTEALTVIDVNSGKAVGKKGRNNILKINLEAAKEAARQIRLRNLSGIIIIDFINLDEDGEMQELLSSLREYLNRDPIPTSLIDVTKLQLVEITRQKIRKPLAESIR